MTGVLVLTAIDLEARGLARRLGLPPVTGSGWPHFRAGALEIIGVGLRASELEGRVGAARRPSLVLSAGACGALSPALAVGDLVIPDVVLTPAGARHPVASRADLTRAGALLSVTDVVETPAAKARLWLATGALAVDMESAVILAWAEARGLPAAVVRAVADTADRAVPADLASVVDEAGRLRTLRAVGVAARRPGALTEAMALRSGTNAALQAVAAALGRLARG